MDIYIYISTPKLNTTKWMKSIHRMKVVCMVWTLSSFCCDVVVDEKNTRFVHFTSWLMWNNFFALQKIAGILSYNLTSTIIIQNYHPQLTSTINIHKIVKFWEILCDKIQLIFLKTYCQISIHRSSQKKHISIYIQFNFLSYFDNSQFLLNWLMDDLPPWPMSQKWQKEKEKKWKHLSSQCLSLYYIKHYFLFIYHFILLWI